MDPMQGWMRLGTGRNWKSREGSSPERSPRSTPRSALVPSPLVITEHGLGCCDVSVTTESCGDLVRRAVHPLRGSGNREVAEK